MTSDEQRIADAWCVAADDLGLTVISPFLLRSRDGGEYLFVTLVKNFGSELGTLICLPYRWDNLGFADVAEDAGYYVSGLYPETYAQYDRGEFIDTLRDGGWFGRVEAEPAWFGEPS